MDRTAIKAESEVMAKQRRTPLFHITSVADSKKILAEGLKGGITPRNRGEVLKAPSIFTLVSADQRLTDDVAIHQIWVGEDLDEYAVIRISPEGITGRVVLDQIVRRPSSSFGSCPWPMRRKS